jgi:hypothetical protein
MDGVGIDGTPQSPTQHTISERFAPIALYLSEDFSLRRLHIISDFTRTPMQLIKSNIPGKQFSLVSLFLQGKRKNPL